MTLAEDESIVWAGRPSPYLVKYWLSISALLVIAGVVLLVWLLPSNWDWLGWIVIVGGAVVGVYAYLAYQSVYYVITSDRVFKKTGIVRTDVETVGLEHIQNSTFSQTLLMRAVRCGDVSISTAGTGTSRLLLRCVPRPAKINGLLTEQVGRQVGGSGL